MRRQIYDEDHEAFRSSVREFMERSVIPNVEEHAAEKAIPREFWLEAGKQGFLGLEIPEEYGGAGAGDYRFNAVLLEEMNKVNAALGSCLGIHADITAPYIVELGTEEQKQRWLPGVAAGEILLAIGMTEPSGGTAAFGAACAACPLPAGRWPLAAGRWPPSAPAPPPGAPSPSAATRPREPTPGLGRRTRPGRPTTRPPGPRWNARSGT